MQAYRNAIIIILMEDFIREKIKEKPLNKKRIAIRIGVSALCGLVFALIACIIFAIFLPIIIRQNQGGEAVVDSIDSETEFVTEIPIETEVKEEEPEDTQVVEPVVKEFTLEDYQKVQSQLYAIGAEANKSVVTVTSVKSDTDWFNNTYDSVGTSAGVIVSSSDELIYIIAEKKAISHADSISVTFVDEDTVPAQLLKYDGNTGLAVLTVEKSAIDVSTLQDINEARFANSNVVQTGMMTIAIGSPLGTNFSILAGTISSTDNHISTVDTDYNIFTTDIVSTAKGSGVLINTAGYVIGLVMQDYGANNNNTITAIGVSDIDPVIDMLIEGKDIPYLGMYVTTVTDSISRNYDLPKGVYIKETVMDSPAMLAGLQSGDVLTAIDGEEIMTVSEYYKKILSMDLEKEYTITVMRQGSEGYAEVEYKLMPGVLK